MPFSGGRKVVAGKCCCTHFSKVARNGRKGRGRRMDARPLRHAYDSYDQAHDPYDRATNLVTMRTTLTTGRMDRRTGRKVDVVGVRPV